MLAAVVHKITCEAFNIPMPFGKSSNIYNNWKSEIYLITLRLNNIVVRVEYLTDIATNNLGTEDNNLNQQKWAMDFVPEVNYQL